MILHLCWQQRSFPKPEVKLHVPTPILHICITIWINYKLFSGNKAKQRKANQNLFWWLTLYWKNVHFGESATCRHPRLNPFTKCNHIWNTKHKRCKSSNLSKRLQCMPPSVIIIMPLCFTQCHPLHRFYTSRCTKLIHNFKWRTEAIIGKSCCEIIWLKKLWKPKNKITM